MANTPGSSRRESRRAEIREVVRELTESPARLPLLWGRRGFWHVRLRWLVAPLMVIGVIAGRLVGFEFAVLPILAIAGANIAYNAVFAAVYAAYGERLRLEPQLDRFITVAQVVADYLAMFLLIHFTGGIWSPLVVFLVFHVIIAAVQFPPGIAYLFAAWAAAGLWVMLLGESMGRLTRPLIAFRGQPFHSLDRPQDAVVMVAVFTAALFIIAAMVSVVMRRLRTGVEELATTSHELSRANEAVEALMRERTQFQLQVAHNLRAPISASLSMLELIRDGSLGQVNEKQLDYSKRIELRLQGLHRMIGELLTIARTRDWSREIPDVSVDMNELARFTQRSFQDEAAAKRLRFSVTAEPGLPHVDSGANLLEQLMENLVSNAIKYTPEGGEVEVRLERGEAEDVRIVVRDTGIGIPEEEQGRLFREFYRASNAKKHTREGTGLGLAIVKRTVERHRGRLEIDSGEGRGTAVRIEIPAHRDG